MAPWRRLDQVHHARLYFRVANFWQWNTSRNGLAGGEASHWTPQNHSPEGLGPIKKDPWITKPQISVRLTITEHGVTHNTVNHAYLGLSAPKADSVQVGDILKKVGLVSYSFNMFAGYRHAMKTHVYSTAYTDKMAWKWEVLPVRFYSYLKTTSWWSSTFQHLQFDISPLLHYK